MNKPYNDYNIKWKGYAREHRNDSTRAEVRLWCELFRKKQMLGYPFLRQRPIDQFIADFFCKPLKLIIETDGISHTWEGAAERDAYKTKRLEDLGYHLLRFQDDDVMNNLSYVKKTIDNWIKAYEAKNPGLAKK